MIHSPRTATAVELLTRPSSSSSFKALSISAAYPPLDKGKAVGKPWADGPWPLIETPSRTQRIAHPALHIANELAHTHNAMLRGLNVLYLQAPYVHQEADIADLLFLAQVWSGWILDHHVLKENAMLPGFEVALSLAPGSLTSTTRLGVESEEDDVREKADKSLDLLLQHVHSYATETLSQPSTYSPSTLQTLLLVLASSLVPHLHAQIPLLVQMRDLCTPSSSTPSSSHSSPTPSPPSSTHRSHSLSEADRSNRLTQIHLTSEAALNAKMDRFAVPPMLVRLRDATFAGSGDAAAWPQLSVPALHAIADRLSPRHAGSWRFLPCDVWGRPRELEFLGE
ncbi:hypothetical protein F4677DRAFT_209951 [Hypoxylon crocopeplum]|nr:hypothetical protein F4677DRAFT_209951 [Hypoxylon crocopeplum]